MRRSGRAARRPRRTEAVLRACGSGDPKLLFVPGWCCDHTAFQPQFDHFSQTHAVAAIDLRGVGRGDAPADGYSIPQLADDVAAFCAPVGIEKPVLVGHSLGGMIADELGARYPELPSALVLVDPGPIDHLPETVEFFTAGRDHRRRGPFPPARGARAGERDDRALPRGIALKR